MSFDVGTMMEQMLVKLPNDEIKKRLTGVGLGGK